jgi:hypothetical protein
MEHSASTREKFPENNPFECSDGFPQVTAFTLPSGVGSGKRNFAEYRNLPDASQTSPWMDPESSFRDNR